MEIVGSICDGFLDIDLSKLKDEKCCYPYHLITYCLYKENIYNNDCMKYEYYEQFKYLSRISSVDKLIAKNRDKMKKKPTSLIPKKINLTKQQGKMFSETKQNISKNFKDKNQQIKQEYVHNDTSPNNKSIISNTNEEIPVANKNRRKKKWSEIYTERRKSRRLSNLPPLDIKIEIKREEIWESHDSVSYNLLTNNAPVNLKQEIVHIHESYITINPQDNNLHDFQNIKKYEQTFNYKCPSSATNKIENTLCLQSIDNLVSSNTTENTTGNTAEIAINNLINSNTTENTIKNTAEITTGNNNVITTESTTGSTTENTADNTTGNNAETADNTTGNNAEIIAENTAEHTTGNNAEIIAENTAEHTTGNNAEIIAENTTGNNAEIIAENTADHTTGNNAEIIAENTAEHTTGNNAETIAEIIVENNAEIIAGNTAGNTNGNNAENTNENNAKNTVVLENIPKTNLIVTENNCMDTNDSNTIKILEKSNNLPKITTFFEPNDSSNYEHKNLDNEVVNPIILKCWSLNASDKQIKITDELTKTKTALPQSETHFNKTQTQEVHILPNNYCNSNTMNIKTHPSSKIHCEKTAIDKLTLQKEDHNTIEMEECNKKKIDYLKMTPIEKKLYRKKLSFVSALGLVLKKDLKKKEIEEYNDKCLNSPLFSRKLIKANEKTPNKTKSENVKCSYLLKYATESTLSDKMQKHIAIPILIRHNASGSSFHPQRTCMLKCSSCHRNFEALDIPCHLAEIKDPNKQKKCLEKTSHLIGPSSCLCSSCFKAIEKLSSVTNGDVTNICIVKNCSVAACHIFKTQFLQMINKLLNQKGIILKRLPELEIVDVCDSHNDQILDISKCQFCGNRTTLKYELQKSELHAFQAVFDKDGVPVTVEEHLLVCDPCQQYFLWRVGKRISKTNTNFRDLRRSIFTRICAFHQIKVPSHLFRKVDIESIEKEFNIKIPSIVDEVEIQPNTNEFLRTSKSVQTITKKNILFKLIRPVTSEDVASFKPIRPITNKNTLSNKPVGSVAPKIIESPHLIMVPTLQPIKNKNNCIQQRPIHKEVNNDTKPLIKPPTFVSVLKPVNSSQYQAPTILPSSTHIIKSFENRQPSLNVSKLLQPEMITSTVYREPRLNSNDKPRTQKIILNNATLRLFKKLQRPYRYSKELFNHLLVVEKYRAQGYLLKMNNTASQIKTKNNNSHSSGITHFKQFPNNNLMTPNLRRITQNNIKPLGNDCLLNTSLHEGEFKKPLPISKYPFCKNNEKHNITKTNKVGSLCTQQQIVTITKHPTATPLATTSPSTITFMPSIKNTINKVNEKRSAVCLRTIAPKIRVIDNKMPQVVITSVNSVGSTNTLSSYPMNVLSGKDVVNKMNTNNNPITNGIDVSPIMATPSESFKIPDAQSLFALNNTYWNKTTTGVLPTVTVRSNKGKLLSLHQLRSAISKGREVIYEKQKT